MTSLITTRSSSFRRSAGPTCWLWLSTTQRPDSSLEMEQPQEFCRRLRTTGRLVLSSATKAESLLPCPRQTTACYCSWVVVHQITRPTGAEERPYGTEFLASLCC